MTLPSNSQSSKNKYIPYGGKRLEALSSNPRSTLSNKRNSSANTKNSDERHSVEFEEKFSVLESDPSFRTRSKTVGDLNEVSDESESDTFVAVSHPHLAQNGGSDGSSCSNLSESSQTGSLAKLDFSSSNPVKYSSVMTLSPVDSPVWKPRNEANVAKQQEFRSKEGKRTTKVLHNQSKLTLPTEICVLKDTEC